MKKRLLLAAVAIATLAATGCHKTCTCIRNDGTEHRYTADEVKAAGKTCYEMRSQGGLYHYYAYCEW